MERCFYELDQGYLNIDDQALYFTRDGNWQNALSAPERSAAGRVDEFCLSMHPLLLGSGIPLYSKMPPRTELSL